ncbi:MAG: tRNA glutamyl-Q(34) synthetase GluQRS [Deltaproteobacteria bacterium]
MSVYVGRLAPSPTGHVHLGIARTSLVAWLDARHHGGRLLMRIEDIDGPRTVEGAADSILADLEWLGLDWDDEPTWQSQRTDAYAAALERLGALGRTFACTCSRKQIREASAPHGPSARYPGTCRDRTEPYGERTPAIRLRTEEHDVFTHIDARLGGIEQNVHDVVGDFVLKRADGLWAYQLAVTVDDLAQGVTCIVRGADLFDSTPRQLLLRSLLDPDAPPPESVHVPLVVDAEGKRLAKRHRAQPIRTLGESPERIVGALARSLDLTTEAAIRPDELLSSYDRARLPTTPTALADDA